MLARREGSAKRRTVHQWTGARRMRYLSGVARIRWMKVYFLGIAGAGVSALASVLVSPGAGATGSDEGVYPPVRT